MRIIPSLLALAFVAAALFGAAQLTDRDAPPRNNSPATLEAQTQDAAHSVHHEVQRSMGNDYQ